MKYCGVGIFRHCFNDPKRISQFEERVVVTEASSKEDATKNILAEFMEYATDGINFLEVYEINKVYAEDIPVLEISSSMKVFAGTNDEYLEKYWDDQKPISCETVGWEHVWFNRGSNRSGCYNCQEERDGELWKNA